MSLIALKMLLGDRAKFIGIVLGLAFASLLITQQGSILVGIVYRTFGVISDAGYADVWVMDPNIRYVEDLTPIHESKLRRVRAVEGVASATPMSKGVVRARLRDGTFQSCSLLGIDDTTLACGPPVMVAGRIEDLRQADGIIVDEVGAAAKLGSFGRDGRARPLQVGDTLELDERAARVVGICRVSRSFNSQPIVYTTFARAKTYAPPERRSLSFVLVKARPGEDVGRLCARIHDATGLAAYTSAGFAWRSAAYFMEKTGIMVNFTLGIGLGILVGAAVAGQAFYNFTADNRGFYAVLKAMGMGRFALLRMILIQASLLGFIGFGCGVGAAAAFGFAVDGSELAFRMPWQLLVMSFIAVMAICAGTALASIAKVARLEPATVFRA